MNNNQQLENLKQEYLKMNVPVEGVENMKQSIDRAKMEKRRMQRKTHIRNAGIGVAAAIVIAVALPNVNADIAYAMSNIPVLGGFFKVVTFRDYQYDDEKNYADVKIPQITVEQTKGEAENSGKLQDSVQKINLDIDKITQDLIDQFRESVEVKGAEHIAIDVTHEVVTDNDRWFTLRLIVLETQASSYQYYKYYTVDKQTGEVVSLADLFQDGSDYIGVITDEIKNQMRTQMAQDENKIYYIDSEDEDAEFEQIKADQNFYFNKEGDLVIAFDEYDVAPGYMGSQEFVIAKSVISKILK